MTVGMTSHSCITIMGLQGNMWHSLAGRQGMGVSVVMEHGKIAVMYESANQFDCLLSAFFGKF